MLFIRTIETENSSYPLMALRVKSKDRIVLQSSIKPTLAHLPLLCRLLSPSPRCPHCSLILRLSAMSHSSDPYSSSPLSQIVSLLWNTISSLLPSASVRRLQLLSHWSYRSYPDLCHFSQCESATTPGPLHGPQSVFERGALKKPEVKSMFSWL